MPSVSAGLPSPSFFLKNVTIDDTDSSVTTSQGWNRSESSFAFGGSFQSSDRIGDIVSFSLPANAVAVYYFGFKQSSGAFYKACLDCSVNSTNKLDNVDGHSDDKISEEPTLLFNLTNLDSSTRHTLRVLNFPDERFGNKSTITVDFFIVTVRDELPSSSLSMGMSMIAKPPASTSSDDSLPSVTTTTTSTSESVSASSDAQDQNSLSAGERAAQKLRSPVVLTGMLLAVLFVVFTVLFAVMYFMRRRKRRRTAPGRMYNYLNGHWAAKFFVERDKKEWDEKVNDSAVNRNAGMNVSTVERRVSNRSMNGLPSNPRPDWPPVSSLVYSRSTDASRTLAVPKSAPARITSSRSGFPSPPLLRSPRGVAASTTSVSSQPLTRLPSATGHALPLKSAYHRAATPPGLKTGVLRAPSPIRYPGLVGENSNSYVAEARARVRDRARGNMNGPDAGHWQQFGPGRPNDYFWASLNGQYQGQLPFPGANCGSSELPAPLPGSGYEYTGYGASQPGGYGRGP